MTMAEAFKNSGTLSLQGTIISAQAPMEFGFFPTRFHAFANYIVERLQTAAEILRLPCHCQGPVR